MSDIFDHAVEAWESFDRAVDDGFCYGRGRRNSSYEPPEPFEADPLYYHRKVRIKKIVAETPRAYLFKVSKHSGIWVPKSVCQCLKKRSVRIHKAVANNMKLIHLR